MFVCGLFNDVCSTENVTLRMISVELEGIWKEAVVASFVLLSRHSLGGTKENYENPQ